MRRMSIALRRVIVPAVAVIAFVAAGPERTWAAAELGLSANDSLLDQACQLVLDGRFAEAHERISGLGEDRVNSDDRVRLLQSWLDAHQKLEARRSAARAEDFEKYSRYTQTLLAELGDAAYTPWIRRVHRTFGLTFGPKRDITSAGDAEGDEASEEEDDDDEAQPDAQRRAEFTAVIDAAVSTITDSDRRERYRNWALADYERYEGGALEQIATLANRRITLGLRGAVLGSYHRLTTLGLRLRMSMPASDEPGCGMKEAVRRLGAAIDKKELDLIQRQRAFDVALGAAIWRDAPTALLANAVAELLTTVPTRPTLNQYVDQLYSYSEALRDAQFAQINAEDEAAFRKLPWVVALTEAAHKEAQARMDRGRWMEALNLVGRLENLHPNDQRFKDQQQVCVDHVRVENFYRAGSHEWRAALEGINDLMVRDALAQVAEHYVVEPNLHAVVSGGLKALLLLIDAEPLTETFTQLDDEFRKEQFRARLRKQLNSVERRERRGQEIESPAWFVQRALSINRETLQLPAEVIVNEFIQGAFAPLDRFTSMIWPAEIAEFRKKTMGNFSGVGIQITMQPGELTVVTPLPDTPAFEAGVAPGDVIVKVDGEPTKNMSINDAVRRITGVAGTQVVLTIRSPESKKSERDIAITRANIEIRTVKGVRRNATGRWNHFLDEDRKIAYIRVTSFMEKTIPNLRETLDTLVDQGARGVILDLRFNPGGLLRTAVDMADLFLPGQQPIVSTKGRGRRESSEMTQERNEAMLFRVTDFSASDQLDLGRVPGLVQQEFVKHELPLSDDAAVTVVEGGREWQIRDGNQTFDVSRQKDDIIVSGDAFAGLPLILMVNDYSASASEIVAGALQDNGRRALVIGERTFGKGSVQNLIPVGNGHAYIKLTTAHYYLPSGRLVHRKDGAETWGVDPDIKVKLVPKEVRAVLNIQREVEVLPSKNELDASARGDLASDADTTESESNKLDQVDPQLEAALLVMRARLLRHQPWPATARGDRAVPERGAVILK